MKSDGYRTKTKIKRRLFFNRPLCFWCIGALCILHFFGGMHTPAAAGAVNNEFIQDIQMFASFEDRRTGSSGSKAAAAYIKERLSGAGFHPIDSHSFMVPVIRHGASRLSFIDQNKSVPIRPFLGNAASPQTIPPPGISGPLIYVGAGEIKDFNGKEIENAIILMELVSGKNWLHAADLGAAGLIYVDREASPKIYFEDKIEPSPIQFPRFWMPAFEAHRLFGSFESAANGRIADEIHLTSDTEWQPVVSENIYCFIPGSDPRLRDELIVVEAFYDSTAHVAGLSPGADEACGISSLLALAGFLKIHPPRRTVLLIASAGHAQSLAGMRELLWSLTANPKDLRRSETDLKSLINATQGAITGMQQGFYKDAVDDASEASDQVQLARNAIKERIKTESDQLSRRLMQLRLTDSDKPDQHLIETLAHELQLLRRLVWQASYDDDVLSSEERVMLERALPKAVKDQRAILFDAEAQLALFDSAKKFRAKVKAYDIAACISLHLSSHGDGVGAFNYGWLYPFRPRINRVSNYSLLDEALRQAAEDIAKTPAAARLFKDTLRPSRLKSWQSFFLDRPPLGGEVSALAGYHGLSLVTTNDARAAWGTPHDTLDKIDAAYAVEQCDFVNRLLLHLSRNSTLRIAEPPRDGFSTLTGRAKFLRHGELFADKPAPGTVLLADQGPARFLAMVDHRGIFTIKGVADSKHSFHKVILEGYKYDNQDRSIIWTIDKTKTDKDAYRVKMQRQSMETDLVMFAGSGITLFNLLEPRTFRYLTKINVIDGRREADPAHYFYSRLDTWSSTISTVFLEPGTPLKLTLSDTLFNKKMILLNSTKESPQGSGYRTGRQPFLTLTAYRVARDMWTLLEPRIRNLENRGIFNERIHTLLKAGTDSLQHARQAFEDKVYDRFYEASFKSWALANRVYEDIEKTQKDVLYGVLFYIALFVPFAFCMERLLFSYTSIYKRIIAFTTILLLLILVIYNVHPAFQLAYSPMVVILAFLIMGLALVVTLIIFFRFEEEVTQLQSRAKQKTSDEIGRWKAFVAAFLLGVSNLRRRRLRTVLTCTTLIILTFTIMSFTSAKSMRRHARLLYGDSSPYHGFLLKNVNWRDLPAEAFGVIANTFSGKGVSAPRVWLEGIDKTRATSIPIRFKDRAFEAQGMIGLSHRETEISPIEKILRSGRWIAENDRQAVLLPERLAVNLGLDIQDSGSHFVSLWGMPFEVVGIFSGEKLQQHVDLDGETLTPVIFPREVSAEMTEEVVAALESGDDLREFQSRYQHIPADLTLIVPFQTLLAAGGNLKGVAIRPERLTALQTAGEELADRYGLSLFSGEKTGTYLYHASDSMQYSGLPNIIIPIVISIFIVLNTMISSVYERKREIGIYTSVGLAPSHVSFLFIAEAMAFAVLSVVLGYLLAQTSAKLFSHTALWSGITVNYSSLSGVGAMLLVILVVMVSVIYPSKIAAEIAIPDVNRSWSLPPPKDNVLEITLPFLMTYAEHRSVGGFLFEYLESHQDITHGKFSTADIDFTYVCENLPGTASAPHDRPENTWAYDRCLYLTSQIWLAPFDFGITQKIELRFKPALEETGLLEIHIKMTRDSGEANAWLRINKSFLLDIRKQLLIWRSSDSSNKLYYEQLLTEAEKRLGLKT